MSRSRSFRFHLVILVGLTLECGRAPPSDRATDRRSSPAALDSLSTLAESLYGAGNYVQARQAWSAGLGLLRTGDIADQARILTSLGLTDWRLGEYQGAWVRTERARALLEANGPRRLLPRTYNALGLIAWDQGRLSEAAELWRRTMQVAREVGDQEYVDKPAMNLGLWYAGIGELGHARHAFATSLTAGRKLGIRALELRSLVNLAMVANRMGEPRVALAWLDSASAAGVNDDFQAEDNYRSQLAMAAWALGDPGVALAGLDSAVRAARLAGLRQSEAANLTLMADIYWEAGDLPRALGLHARAEAIHSDLNLPGEQGQNLHSAARIRAVMGHTDQARNLALRALRLHQQSEDPEHQLDDLLLLAELGGPGHLEEARRIAGELSVRAVRTKLGLAEARIAASGSRPRDVLRALASIAADLAGGLSAEVSEAEALRAQAYGSLERWDSAAAAGRRAIGAFERIRSSHGSGLLRASFASFRAGVYGGLVTAMLALGQTEEAFEVADGARGGGSRARRPSGHESQAPARDELLSRIAGLEDEIRGREEDDLDTAELQERLRQAEREYEVAVLSADLGASTAVRPNARAGRVREALAPDELLLAYLVTPDQLFVFIVSREHTGVAIVKVRAADLEASVRLAREFLGDRTSSPADAEAVLGTLSRWLLGSVGDRMDGVRRLIVVPHGALAYAPFSALKAAGGKYLVERYSLVHLPSASFAGRQATRASAETGLRLEVTALAPLPHDLPATIVEVNAVGRVHRGARLLSGPRATEPALRLALRSGAAVHVATHGVLNRMNPLFSRIELVPGRGGSPADDGRLEVHEVLGLEIRSPLVFLSGCETGLGPGTSTRYSPGEDYATLAAAFLTAGAGQVVATLWTIPDTGAAVFAARFYVELARSRPAEALAATQRALLRDSRFRHPYYWAGYRLAGSEPTGRRTTVL